MDRLIYTAMSGAAQALEQQSVTANNLANASTTGFRAQLSAFRQVPMSFENGAPGDATTRTFVLSSPLFSKFIGTLRKADNCARKPVVEAFARLLATTLCCSSDWAAPVIAV